MTDGDPKAGERKGMSPPLKLALLAALAVGATALLIAVGSSVFHPGPSYVTTKGPAGTSTTAAADAAAPGAATKTLPAPSAKGVGELAPATPFKDGAGATRTLADFKGQVAVVNLWATWCGPCVKEMPTLAALQALSAGKPIKVVAVSQDAAKNTDKAKAFIARHKPLDFYQDAGTALPFALKPAAPGFPTTVVFDKTGRERLRVEGELDWSTPRVRRTLDALAAE